MFEPQALPPLDTQKVPGPLKIAVLKLPLVTIVLQDPVTVASIKGPAPLSLEVESIVLIQPCVEST